MWYMLQDGLRTWAKQIESALCLINGKAVTDDAELLSGPVSLGVFVVVVLIIPQFFPHHKCQFVHKHV